MICMFLSLFTLASFVEASPATPADSSLQSQMTHQLESSPIYKQTEKPNEIKGTNVSYTGILVQLIKRENPLQLVNPVAPARYGSAQANVDRSPFTGRADGLKFFSLSF